MHSNELDYDLSTFRLAELDGQQRVVPLDDDSDQFRLYKNVTQVLCSTVDFSMRRNRFRCASS